MQSQSVLKGKTWSTSRSPGSPHRAGRRVRGRSCRRPGSGWGALRGPGSRAPERASGCFPVRLGAGPGPPTLQVPAAARTPEPFPRFQHGEQLGGTALSGPRYSRRRPCPRARPPVRRLPGCPSSSHHPHLPRAPGWNPAAAPALGLGPGPSPRRFVLESRRVYTPAGGFELQPTAWLFWKNEKWGVCASERSLRLARISVLLPKGGAQAVGSGVGGYGGSGKENNNKNHTSDRQRKGQLFKRVGTIQGAPPKCPHTWNNY